MTQGLGLVHGALVLWHELPKFVDVDTLALQAVLAEMACPQSAFCTTRRETSLASCS